MNKLFIDIIKRKKLNRFQAIDYFYYAGYSVYEIFETISNYYPPNIRLNVFDFIDNPVSQLFYPMVDYCRLDVSDKEENIVYWFQGIAIIARQDVKRRSFIINEETINDIEGVDKYAQYPFIFDFFKAIDNTLFGYTCGMTVIDIHRTPFYNKVIRFENEMKEKWLNEKIYISKLDIGLINDLKNI